jgi:alpha/beta superfamily hydrolase
MASEQIAFEADDATCEGVFVLPETVAQAPGLVICHPHPLRGGDMHNAVVRGLAEAFVAADFAVLRFNFRGVGGSTGRYGEGIGEQQDTRAAVEWLTAQPGVDPARLFVAGYSFGARVTLAMAATDPRLCGFIAVAPPVLHGEWPSLQSSRGPKLFLCGEHDSHAPLEVLADRVRSLPEPKRLLIFPDTDHFFVGQERAVGQHALKLLQEFSPPITR